MNVEQNSGESKTSRRRFKKLCAKIMKQMEFYFSDSNLAKDKFLSDLIAKDPEGYVDLEIFMSFNKIKHLTENYEVIASAVLKSSLFEVSKDQKRVRRITPIELSKDFDACTLYAERLPTHADQKWVLDVFGNFGTIRYVNVPRYKVSNKIKGFAFVEFEAPDSVKKACEFYKMASEKECTTSEDESKNSKNAKKHKHDDSPDKRSKKSRARTASESSDKLADSSSLKNDYHHHHHHHGSAEKSMDHRLKYKRKRRREDSVGEDASKKSKSDTSVKPEASAKEQQPVVNVERNVIPIAEKMAVDEVEVEIKSESPIKLSNIKNGEDSFRTAEEVDLPKAKVNDISDGLLNESELEDKTTDLDESKSKRKRRNSKKHRSHHADKPTLRVMPKSEWKAYRNKYLELQRSTMSMLKKQILFELQELKDQENSTKTAEVTDTKKSLKYQPGVIIKVNLSGPVKSSLDIKDQVKANAVVAYIDAPVESSEIFIRCHSPGDALLIMKDNKLGQIGKAELLKDEDEKQYWDKIESDRKIKFNNPVPHKKRGRDKLIAKAAKLEEMRNKHIYFDE